MKITSQYLANDSTGNYLLAVEKLESSKFKQHLDSNCYVLMANNELWTIYLGQELVYFFGSIFLMTVTVTIQWTLFCLFSCKIVKMNSLFAWEYQAL